MGESEAITGGRTVVDPAALGLRFEALVLVTMDREDRSTLRDLEAGIAQMPQVVSAERLFGDPEHLLRIVTTDLEAHHAVQDDQVGVLPPSPPEPRAGGVAAPTIVASDPQGELYV